MSSVITATPIFPSVARLGTTTQTPSAKTGRSAIGNMRTGASLTTATATTDNPPVIIREKVGLRQMVYMMLANILFLFRKMRIMVEGGLDLAHPPKMAYSLQYSTIRATNTRKKDHFYFSMNPNTYNAVADNCSKSLMKKVLDNCVSLCYNGNIIIEKAQNAPKPIAAQPVNISPFTSCRKKPNMIY